MPTITKSSRLNLNRHALQTTAVDIEYFCRGCKGHYSRIVQVDGLGSTNCRCGSTDLLVYSIAGVAAAPLRGV